jgi:hypothetical protein
MSSSRAEIYAELYTSAVVSTVKAAEEVPESNRFRQTADGKAHPLWLLGHLTATMDLLVNSWMLGLEMTMPPAWGTTFGPTEFGGAPITADPSDYPAWDDILKQYKVSGASAAKKIATLSDDDMQQYALGPMPKDMYELFGTLLTSIPDDAIHDAYHRGQMTLLGKLD